ncbi:MAG: 16S rRNA (adenine(1518)-N(6)/adenine(1519)-N(6))-dimethyltransferase RsmA [Gammaproteobacteria bacterium]|nr:16S rRNA (adenine(1518)-N(6)/adenine(1519)-N(6))-dimethyltransferase RsmA [Gammaproteobacteria bacterium]MBU1731095.1 16S rRNA (adenine(1518)-N(6)/adenine(1519)-N(6))-dimethyltransferase RsmA [Gammaproteobacteria bacterium]MBU1894159.1 16S rRNA (adenine(1518)-N(6)/adenine(1519)-N(6))-dimethyltransferase RsmA [Gammaproteobacteria bacterium]
MKHIPRKRFGQNFLIDRQVIADIVAVIRPKPDDVMVEIGPGLGAITQPLLKTLHHLHVVEIDRDIVARLHREYAPERLTIHACDALKFDFGSLGGGLRVVGNLPYNISTPLLFHLADHVSLICDLHFMLQKEVVERMVAEPSTPAYGRLSVMLQYYFAMENLLHVPPQAFSPAPKVDSAVVRMIPWRERPFPECDENLLRQVVTAAFSMRRKTLKNTLHPFLKPADFEQIAIEPGLRAENLAVQDYVRIVNYLGQQA